MAMTRKRGAWWQEEEEDLQGLKIIQSIHNRKP
jgi:hypothetical protein